MAETWRSYPVRPILAVSAAIIRDGRVLLVKRARPPSAGVFTLPGGVVEVGETLEIAVRREVREELALDIAVTGLAGIRDVIERDPAGRVVRHFVILSFAARCGYGEPRPNEEIAEARWRLPADIASLPTTEGLAPIIAKALELVSNEKS